jgi:hypothetical protein
MRPGDLVSSSAGPMVTLLGWEQPKGSHVTLRMRENDIGLVLATFYGDFNEWFLVLCGLQVGWREGLALMKVVL